jgi:hypothetical protein
MLLRYLVVLATAIAIFLVGALRPAHNFDIVGYVATAHYKQGLRGEALAQRTYAEVSAEIGPARLSALLNGPYGGTVRSDPVSLEQQLPFYTIRQGYVWLMELAHKAGMDYARSSYLIAAFFQAVSVLLLGLIAASVGVSLWVIPGVVFLANYGELAQLSTPDAMACAFTLAATLLALRRSPWACLFAVALPLVRTDFVLFSALLMGVMFLQGRRLVAVAGLVAAVAAYVLNNKLNAGYSYLTVFHFTLIGLDPYPAKLVVSTNPADYLAAYGRMLKTVARSPHVVIYFVAACLAIIHRKALFGSLKRAGGCDADLAALYLLLLVPAAFVVAHLVLLPIYTERYFAYPASLILLWVIWMMSRSGGLPAVGGEAARY